MTGERTYPVEGPGPTRDYCQGDKERCTVSDDKCPLFGVLGREGRDGNRRVRLCGDPSARGKRNRAKGDFKARKARKALGLVGANTRHEEHLGGPVRMEAKAGAQVLPIASRFQAAERQSEAARPIGDHRPFAMVALPDGWKDGIVLIRMSTWHDIIRPLLEEAR